MIKYEDSIASSMESNFTKNKGFKNTFGNIHKNSHKDNRLNDNKHKHSDDESKINDDSNINMVQSYMSEDLQDIKNNLQSKKNNTLQLKDLKNIQNEVDHFN